MSAEILREAAALMRERAFQVAVVDEHTSVADPLAPANAEHIASWHPAVALAVADWLTGCALVLEVTDKQAKAHAIKVARAYLGRTS